MFYQSHKEIWIHTAYVHTDYIGLYALHFQTYAYTLKIIDTVKPVLNGHSQKDRKLFFKNNYHLMQVKSIAECSPFDLH